jgi:hypothetical protein
VPYFGPCRNIHRLSQARGAGRFALYTMRCRASLGIMRQWSFHRWGGKRHPASFCGDPAGELGVVFSRPMLPARSAPPPGPRQGGWKFSPDYMTQIFTIEY